MIRLPRARIFTTCSCFGFGSARPSIISWACGVGGISNEPDLNAIICFGFVCWCEKGMFPAQNGVIGLGRRCNMKKTTTALRFGSSIAPSCNCMPQIYVCALCKSHKPTSCPLTNHSTERLAQSLPFSSSLSCSCVPRLCSCGLK